MKKFINVILLLLLFESCLLAQSDSIDVGNNNLATIYFYRLNNYYGSAVKMKILSNDQPIIRLKNKSYYVLNTQPGDYYFSCSMGTESKIKVNVEPGKKYYVKCYINSGFWSGNPQLELVESPVGNSIIEGGMLAVQAYEPISLTRSKSRIGLNMGGGAGFESVQLFVDENNENVTLSSGGGFAIGAKYGYEISKYFDLSIDWYYQTSSLSRSLENAEASFNRMIITLTPALIIPIKEGDYYRFKIGGGVGNYISGQMYIDASDAGGEEITLNYNSTIGSHLCFNFESNFSDHFSMSLGLKYYNANYKYNSEESSHSITEKEFSNPNGSGLDFIFGYYYHF